MTAYGLWQKDTVARNLKANLALVKSHPVLTLTLLAVILMNIVYVMLYVNVKYKLIAEPVRIAITASSERDLDSVSVYCLKPRGVISRVPIRNGAWSTQETYFKSIRLAVPNRVLAEITTVRVTLGEKTFVYTADQLVREWTKVSGDSSGSEYDSPLQLRSEHSVVPFFSTVINWPGDEYVLKSTVASIAKTLLLCLLLAGLSFAFINFGGLSSEPITRQHRAVKPVVLCCVLFSAVYAFYYAHETQFSDRVFFGGDQWEYQAMAVNFAKGHGLQLHGGIEPFETYKFEEYEDNSQEFATFLSLKTGWFDVYRSPAYPLFLGSIYKVVGISPENAKQCQLFLLILIAAFLPFVGYVYWDRRGFLGGLLGGILFMESNRFMANIIMTEALITFALFLNVLLFMLYERRRTIGSAVLLGIGLGLALLVKGDLVFLPPLFVAVIFFRSLRKKVGLLQVWVIVLSCLLTVAPWSVYASLTSHQLVFISTQGNAVLLEGNNEGSFEDGKWHAEVVKDPGGFYNRPEIRDFSTAQKLWYFYRHHLSDIPLMMHRKLSAGFNEFFYIKLAVMLTVVIMLKHDVFDRYRAKVSTLRGRVLWYGGIALLCLLVGVGIASFSVALLSCAVVTILAGRGRTAAFSCVPTSFVLAFLNFVLITVMIFGEARFVSVIDFMGILTSLALGLSLLLGLPRRLSTAQL